MATYYDTPVGVGGKINTSTGQILSGPQAGQTAQKYTTGGGTAPAADQSTPITPVSTAPQTLTSTALAPASNINVGQAATPNYTGAAAGAYSSLTYGSPVTDAQGNYTGSAKF